jgi:hypothetical protein
MQPGNGYSLSAGQNGTSLTVDFPEQQSDPDQFKVNCSKVADGVWGVSVRKGFVSYFSYFAPSPWAAGPIQAEVHKVWAFPTDAKEEGPFADEAATPWVDKGGYVKIDEDKHYGVFIVMCSDTEISPVPYLAILEIASGADNYTDPFPGGFNMYVFYKLVTFVSDPIEVVTPSGTTTFSVTSAPQLYAYNYNCLKWKIADLTWEDGVFKVDQQHLGPLALPNFCLQNSTATESPGYTPSWLPSVDGPYYEAEKDLWFGTWSGYTKNTADATVTL